MTAPSEQIIEQVRAEIGPRTMLAFSRGKDAIGAALAIRDRFDEVVPYHLDLVPGLEIVEESIGYYEQALFGGRRIIRLPHPSMARWFRNLTFQPPPHAAVLAAADLPQLDYQDTHLAVREIAGLPAAVMAASGVRAADSPMRRLALTTHGAISRNTGHYYPVWDWNKERLLGEIERAGIRLPADYALFGRTFDGLDLRFVYPLKQQRPADYRRILEWFPFVEAEVWRYERWGRA